MTNTCRYDLDEFKKFIINMYNSSTFSTLLKPTDECEVFQLIKPIKNSHSTFHIITNKIIIKYSNPLLNPITCIINIILQTGSYPRFLKR